MPRIKTYDDLRNIRRWIVFDRGLELYNKRYGDNLTHNDVAVMYCIRHHNRVGKLMDKPKVVDWMQLMHKDYNMARFNRIIKKILGKGYIQLTGRYYFMTPAGNTVIQDIERTVKQQRIDR
jgi:hypothetical protein